MGHGPGSLHPPSRAAASVPADDVPPRSSNSPSRSPIYVSQDQLAAEVKGICAGLVMVRSKCIKVDNNHAEVVER